MEVNEANIAVSQAATARREAFSAAVVAHGGEPTVKPSAPSQQFMTDATVRRIEQIAANPVPKEQPAAAPSQQVMTDATVRRIAQIAAGKVPAEQTGTPAPTGEADPAVLAHLTKHMRETLPKFGADTKGAAAYKAEWEQMYATALDGRKLTETVAQFRERQKGGAPTAPIVPPAGTTKPDLPNPNIPAVDDVAATVHAYEAVIDSAGFAPLASFPKEHLSGYTLPKYLANQGYHVQTVIDGLKRARDLNLTQFQVNQHIKDVMVAAGFKV
jgi:hypothetical protein